MIKSKSAKRGFPAQLFISRSRLHGGMEDMVEYPRGMNETLSAQTESAVYIAVCLSNHAYKCTRMTVGLHLCLSARPSQRGLRRVS